MGCCQRFLDHHIEDEFLWKELLKTKLDPYDSNNICDALRNLVTFVQFKKREKHPRFQPATLLKVTLRGCFSRFLNCANGTKSFNVPYLFSYALK